MKDRKFGSMHAAHSSFIDADINFNGIRRETEVASAKLSLRYLDTYQRDKVEYARKGKVDSETARRLASVEASAMFLYTADNAPSRTYDVVRSLWTQVYSGVLDEQKLKGNVLLLGSGDTIPEVMALHVHVEVNDVAMYRQVAEIHINAIEQKVEPLILAGKEFLESHVLRVTRPRLSQGKKIDCVEPDELFASAVIADLLVNKNFFPDTTFYKTTAGEFIDSTDQQYDLVLAMRTEPMMWSTRYAEYDFGEVVVPGFTGHNNMNILRYIDREVGSVYREVKRLVAKNGSLYVSVGLGNDSNGFSSRVYLLENIANYGKKDNYFPEVMIDREGLLINEWEDADPEVAVLVMTNKTEKRRPIQRKKKKRRR